MTRGAFHNVTIRFVNTNDDAYMSVEPSYGTRKIKREEGEGIYDVVSETRVRMFIKLKY